jgi:hypothetical protein
MGGNSFWICPKLELVYNINKYINFYVHAYDILRMRNRKHVPDSEPTSFWQIDYDALIRTIVISCFKKNAPRVA